ncbi:hypothetical protein Vadar_029713 [Vaccinium darrowii]|uniref:Uncharacterized protein n=1 Tax=Vaccinium darrowii TaxID=229202 RepID=A0ACB7YRQ7_9ERIC|nr:hypothetical protein Vadar_029713 [Vaccinium darrowii]
MDAKATKHVSVGYDPNKKGWHCMDPETHKVVTSRDVVFNEISSFYTQHVVTPPPSDGREDEQNFSKNVISSSLVSDELRGRSSKEIGNSEVVQEDLALRRSTRDRKRHEKFKDYHLDVDNCNICECFFAGPIDELRKDKYYEIEVLVFFSYMSVGSKCSSSKF